MDRIIHQPDSVPPGCEMKLFGQRVTVKNYICARDGEPYRLKQGIRLQLTIQITRYCSAGCPFCIAAPTHQRGTVDPDRLREILRCLRRENIVRGVSITGGEPFAYPDAVNWTIGEVFSELGPETEVSVTTNGEGLIHLKEIEDLEKVANIHISRHHWDDRKNNLVFRKKMPGAAELREAIRAVPYREMIVLNCMLLKGYVDSPENVHRYLDFALEIGAPKTGFFTAYPVSRWTAENRVRFDAVLRREDPALLFTRGYRDGPYCRCQDGVYVAADGRITEFYGRQPEQIQSSCCRGLVITPEGELRTGFGGSVLL